MDPKIVSITESEYEKFGDFSFRSQFLYPIRTEDNRRVMFKVNESQRILDDAVKEEVRRTKEMTGHAQVKIICLKSRQVGFTTYTEVFGIDKSLHINDFRGAVFTHDEKDQELIWNKYQFTSSRLPDYLDIYSDDMMRIIKRIQFRPEFVKDSGTNLKYANQTESEIYMRHAGSADDVGKGDTLNFVHFSEAANYDHYTVVKSSVSQQLPDQADTFMFIESTANGMTGKGAGFYEEWVRSEEMWRNFVTGKIKNFTGYRPVFVPWFQMKKYSRPIYHGEMSPIDQIKFQPFSKKEYLEMESMWREEFNLTPEQINWYRYNIVAKCDSKLSEAFRYYPATPEQAFQATTNSMFDTNILIPVKKKYDEGNGEDFRIGYIDENFCWVDDEFGQAMMRHEPEQGYTGRYYISLDQSKGKEDGDFSVITVYDRLLDTFAFQWRGKEREDIVAELLIRVGIFYGFGTLVPEANLSAVIVMIQPDGIMPYEGEVYIQRYNQNGEIQYGLYMDVRTRRLVLSTYLNWINPPNTKFHRYDSLIGHDSVMEHINFVRKVKANSTKFEAQDNFHDDIVMSNAIAVYSGLNDPEPIRFNGKILDKHTEQKAEKEFEKIVAETNGPATDFRRRTGGGIRQSMMGRKKTHKPWLRK